MARKAAEKTETKKKSSKVESQKVVEAQETEIEYDETEVAQDPLVKKLIEFGSANPFITWDKITEILTADFVNSPKMEVVLSILTKNNIPVISFFFNIFIFANC